MDVPIPAELEQFVHDSVQSGSYRDTAAVISEALRLLARREHLRREVNAGVEQLAQGKGIDGEEVFARLHQKAEAIARRASDTQ